MGKSVFDILQAAGALATAFSVLWAIYIYRRAEDRRAFSKARETLASINSIMSQLDGTLSEPEFSMVGHCISKEAPEGTLVGYEGYCWY